MAERETATVVDPQRIQGYHAHIYYDPSTRAVADQVRQAIAAGFEARVGNWHDEPVGPHPVSMYQVAFAVSEFPRLVPWLMLNRRGLDVLVHPMTEDPYDDHSVHAMWLGKPLPLRLDVLRRTGSSGLGMGVPPALPDQLFDNPKLPAGLRPLLAGWRFPRPRAGCKLTLQAR